MKLKTLALAVLLTGTVAGVAQARGPFFQPNPDRILARISAELELSAEQQAKVGDLVQQAVALAQQAKAERAAMRRASREELARPDADLPALALEHQTRVDARIKEARLLRDRALMFYTDDLTPSQQVAARAMLLDRLNRFEMLLPALSADSVMAP